MFCYVCHLKLPTSPATYVTEFGKSRHVNCWFGQEPKWIKERRKKEEEAWKSSPLYWFAQILKAGYDPIEVMRLDQEERAREAKAVAISEMQYQSIV